jgi:hypothetical protein
MVYGFMLTGETKYWDAAKELFETGYKHISTKNQSELDAITKTHFPPQDCFIHNAEQASEGANNEPWCSAWMAEMLVDPLLQYQEIAQDNRVDDIFVRLARSLRDAGTVYQAKEEAKDTFLAPQICYDPAVNGDFARKLVPLYGFGTGTDQKRYHWPDGVESEHCADATAVTAAALRALKRQGKLDAPGPAPFKTEGESILALHHELSHCADILFSEKKRPNRDPRGEFKQETLAEGFKGGDPKGQDKFFEDMHIGYTIYVQSPLRELSWWFNGSVLQFRMLEEAGVPFTSVRPGAMQAANCTYKKPWSAAE